MGIMTCSTRLTNSVPLYCKSYMTSGFSGDTSADFCSCVLGHPEVAELTPIDPVCCHERWYVTHYSSMSHPGVNYIR